MKVDCLAGGNGQRSAFFHDEAIHNAIGARVAERGIFGDMKISNRVGILPGGSHYDSLLYTVGHKTQIVEHVERRGRRIDVDTRFYKNVYTVFAAHFHVGKFFAAAAVDVHIEFRSLGRSCKRDALDVELLLMTIVDQKTLCRRNFAGKYCVKTQRIDRKFRQITAPGGKIVLNARTHPDEQH